MALDAKALKFFPASAAGGIDAPAAFAAVFPAIKFCPTGGITAQSAPSYLALDCVECVGGGWLTPQHRFDARDWGPCAEWRKKLPDCAGRRSLDSGPCNGSA